MRIAIIGSGIAGLVCGRLLSREHDVTVFEADSRIGGHSNTVSVTVDGQQHDIDTGFIVFNDQTYPEFSRILADLGVRSDATSMSFSVRCDRTGLEYNGTNLNGVFAQRTNIGRPSFLRMIRDILRFNKQGAADVTSVSPDQTVGEYLALGGYSRQFADQYLLPMGAAIWSCPCHKFAEFPIRFILEFYAHHGLLSLHDRPQWRTVTGGSKQYVQRLVEPFRSRVRLDCSVESVRRFDNGVVIQHALGQDEFDEVVFACHSDQAHRMLTDADSLETELLSAFPYSSNTAVLHTDESVLPRRRRAWASWNYHIGKEPETRPAVTYNMNILQHIQSHRTFCVTLNNDDRIKSDTVLARFRYSHPLFTTTRAAMQTRHDEVIRHRRTSFCGAYWRNGFHEDGVVSALAVCRKFGILGWTPDLRPPTLRLSLDVMPKPQSGLAVGERA